MAGVLSSAVNRCYAIRYPHNHAIYRKDAFHRLVKLGEPHLTFTQGIYICNLPIRQYPQDELNMGMVEVYLNKLADSLPEGVSSVTTPPIGSGYGKIDMREIILNFGWRIL